MANNHSNSQLKTENERLRRRIRELSKERQALQKERDQYLQALLQRLKKESQEDDWRDFDPADYQYTLDDIFAQFEKEEGVEGVCLPRNTVSSTPARSRKSSRTSSAKPKKRVS